MLVNDYEKSFDIILCHYPDTEVERVFFVRFRYSRFKKNEALSRFFTDPFLAIALLALYLFVLVNLSLPLPFY